MVMLSPFSDLFLLSWVLDFPVPFLLFKANLLPVALILYISLKYGSITCTPALFTLSAPCSFPLKNSPKVDKGNAGNLVQFAVLKLLAPLWSFRLRGKLGETWKVPLGVVLTELLVCLVLSLARLRGCSLNEWSRRVPQCPD